MTVAEISRLRWAALRAQRRTVLQYRNATRSHTVREMAKRNAAGSQPLLGDADVAVSLTSFGKRLLSVHLTIETIGRGSVRPKSITLWLDENAPDDDALPAALHRLVDRGLTIDRGPNLGPHKKYFHHAMSSPAHTRPLVTADDDVLYSRRWLQRLVEADGRAAGRRIVPCHRARRIQVVAGRLATYLDWHYVVGTDPSILHFPTGTAGVLYQPALLDALREAGLGFQGKCDRADDIWLHAVALRNGFAGAQLRQMSSHPPGLPGEDDDVRLWAANVVEGGNDVAVVATYEPADIALLSAAQGSAGPSGLSSDAAVKALKRARTETGR